MPLSRKLENDARTTPVTIASKKITVPMIKIIRITIEYFVGSIIFFSW